MGEIGDQAHLTVLAWRSMGAPETTAAGRVSPGSLPSRTRFGTGEKVEVAESISAPQSGWWVVDIDGTCSSLDSIMARESDWLDD